MSGDISELCAPVPGAGGLVGYFKSDRGSINSVLRAHNAMGYRMVGFNRDVRTNLLYTLISFACLFLTIFIWRPKPVGILFFRRGGARG